MVSGIVVAAVVSGAVVYVAVLGVVQAVKIKINTINKIGIKILVFI